MPQNYLGGENISHLDKSKPKEIKNRLMNLV